MKINKIGKLLAFSFLTAFSITSCTEDAMDKVNNNPNNPTDAPAKFLITDLGSQYRIWCSWRRLLSLLVCLHGT